MILYVLRLQWVRMSEAAPRAYIYLYIICIVVISKVIYRVVGEMKFNVDSKRCR